MWEYTMTNQKGKKNTHTEFTVGEERIYSIESKINNNSQYLYMKSSKGRNNNYNGDNVVVDGDNNKINTK